LRVIDALLAVALVGHAVAVSDLYFFFDDFYFLDKAIEEPLLRLAAPQEHFSYRPLSEYGFFALGWSLFGTRATGYFLLNLAVMALVVLAVPGTARFLGFDAVEARIGAALLAVSPPAVSCLSWLSNVQHSLDILFLVWMLRLEIRWLEHGLMRDKALAVLCFGLGLTTNTLVVVGLPLLVLLYLRHATRESAPSWRRLARGFLAAAVPCLLLSAAFVAVARTSPAWAALQAGMADPTHPYFLRLTPSQAITNLGHFVALILPYGAASLPVTLALFAAFGLRCAVLRRAAERVREELLGVGFALAWILVSLAPFLFLANRINPSMGLLAGVVAFPLLARLVLGPVRGLAARWGRPGFSLAAGLALLAGHTALAWMELGQYTTGAQQREGLARIRELARVHHPDARTLYLVNEARRGPTSGDWVFTSYGYGRINPVFVDGRRIVFLSEHPGHRLERLREDEGVIRYRGNFRFYVRGRRSPPG
jgi:hypothetical protein